MLCRPVPSLFIVFDIFLIFCNGFVDKQYFHNSSTAYEIFDKISQNINKLFLKDDLKDHIA